jgi:NitT/TauT family transport system substrate-binding protein
LPTDRTFSVERKRVGKDYLRTYDAQRQHVLALRHCRADGIFQRRSINAIVGIMQNQVVVNGVVTRNVDYGGTFSNFVGAALSGLPVRIVMFAMDGSDHYLVTSPNVKRAEDLKGKTFGISSFGGTPHSEAVMILQKYGMNPERDVTFLQIGGSSSRYTAMQSGSIQAAMLVPPFNNFATKRGFISFCRSMKS